MPHHMPLISTIVVGLVMAFVLGAIAHRLRLSPLVGYLLAGVLVGPFTPGYVADQALANRARRDRRDPADVRRRPAFLAERSALRQGHRDSRRRRADRQSRRCSAWGWPGCMGWTIGGGLVFGLALSVASTVVLLRALQERRLVETERGRIAVGWLIVEDLAMVLALVLLPAFAGRSAASGRGRSLGSHRSFRLGHHRSPRSPPSSRIMLIVGRRVDPWILHYVAHTGSRELFRLAVLRHRARRRLRRGGAVRRVASRSAPSSPAWC